MADLAIIIFPANQRRNIESHGHENSEPTNAMLPTQRGREPFVIK
jgi:hypothetical protein